MELTKPGVKAVRAISPVWIIPIVTVVIGIWLGVNSWRDKGTDIEVIFDTASGIKVGKTEVRLKDVPVGKVTDVRLSEDLSRVRVVIALDRQVSQHLSENSRFWLVRPRVSATGVSNLGTLISGVYIVMDPGEPGGAQSVFTGLTEPPAVQSDDKGTQYILLADNLGSLDIGSPVYYRSVRVGEVTGYKLGDDGSHVEIRIFIQAPYDKMVYTRTHFWNVSGFGLTVNASGIKAEMASLASLISGGVAFENTVGFEVTKHAPSDYSFNLYSDQDSIVEGRYILKYFYLLKFSHSVRGLNVGAPVEFRGLKVGEVVEVTLNSVQKGPDSLHVFVSIEPQRLQPDATPTREEFDAMMARLVGDGLRAQMRSGSLITGSRYIALAFPGDADAGQFVSMDKYSLIPTQESASEQLDQQLATIAGKIASIPMDDIGKDAADTLASVRKIMATLEQNDTAGKIDKTLANVSEASGELDNAMQEMTAAFGQLTTTLQGVDSVVAPDSRLQYELHNALRSIDRAAKSLDSLLEQLHQKPDALIFGAEND